MAKDTVPKVYTVTLIINDHPPQYFSERKNVRSSV